MLPIIDAGLLLVVSLAARLNSEQAAVVDYLLAEVGVLREQLKARGGRLRFTDTQRRRLAVKAMALGRRALRRLEPIVTPDTLLRWHRQLIARKYDGCGSPRPGRPRLRQEVEDLIVRMATDNHWGYLRIQGALLNLGHAIARTTIASVLARHGIEPAPKRKTTWAQFLRTHWTTLAAADFFTVEIWSPVGLVRYSVLCVIKLATREVHIAGVVRDPGGAWMEQIARNLIDAVDGFLLGVRYLIFDRDPLFTEGFQRILKMSGTEVVRLPPRSPNLNPFAERFVLSIKSECLDRMIFFSEKQLRLAVAEYALHYHTERNHQGLDNRLIKGNPREGDGEVVCDERLGGLLKYYRRAA